MGKATPATGAPLWILEIVSLNGGLEGQ